LDSSEGRHTISDLRTHACSAKAGSLECLDLLLDYDGCDVDYVNLTEGATPLHLAITVEDEEERADVVESLLDAGADFT
jgi:uncharacterized protein